MIHPFEPDLRDTNDQQLDEKISDLTKKYFTAYRLGNRELLTQLSTFITIYKDERQRRHFTKNKNNSLDSDLDSLINVD
jgi:hypothetical protein